MAVLIESACGKTIGLPRLVQPILGIVSGALLLTLSGCKGGGGNLDIEALASALRFVGVCSVLCSLIWATALIVASRNRNERR